MAQFTAANHVTELRRTPARDLIARRVEALFVGDASVLQVLCLAGLPVLGGLWLMLTPERLFSREMTWDLMFNLSGAWQVYSGHVPHVDYHDPIGPLGFWLTQLGFSAVGLTPLAFLAGQTIFLVFAFAAALVVASRRLATIAAILFVLYAALLVLMPVNVGDQPNAYTFAMSYNRWGWSALTTLCLLLFLPPRRGHMAWLDAIVGALLLVSMFYLKITFAVAGLAALALALLVSSYVRERWWTWAAVFVLVIVNALAPYNNAYIADIVGAASGGYQRPALDQLRTLLVSKAEYALYGTGVVLLVWMWRRGRATLQSVIFAVAVLCLGNLVVSQSAQEGAIPVGTVIAYLLYDALRGEHRTTQAFRSVEVLPLAAILTWPALSIASAMTTVGGYHAVAMRDTRVLTVETTNLRGLAVPNEEQPSKVSATLGFPYQLLSTSLDRSPKHQISDLQYVQTLIEAASFFADGRRSPVRILVIDQVNPLPFMLGYPPPHGSSLWLWPDMPARPAEEVFGDVDVVLIPKFSTYSRSTLTALETYHEYLSATFPVHEQSPSWTILSR